MNWSNFWFGFVRTIFLCIGIDAINPNLSFWGYMVSVFAFMIAMEMTVHLIRRERIAEGKEKA